MEPQLNEREIVDRNAALIEKGGVGSGRGRQLLQATLYHSPGQRRYMINVQVTLSMVVLMLNGSGRQPLGSNLKPITVNIGRTDRDLPGSGYLHVQIRKREATFFHLFEIVTGLDNLRVYEDPQGFIDVYRRKIDYKYIFGHTYLVRRQTQSAGPSKGVHQIGHQVFCFLVDFFDPASLFPQDGVAVDDYWPLSHGNS